jgi:stage II sporulation protein D
MDPPYLTHARCHWCRDCPYFAWEHRAAASKVGAQLSAAESGLRRVDRLTPTKRTSGGRVYALQASGEGKRLNISGERLREALGYGSLKSARFSVTKRGNMFHFRGRGFGHGLGACQWGMKGLAEKGFTWRRILDHYYKNVEIARIRQEPIPSVRTAAP